MQVVIRFTLCFLLALPTQMLQAQQAFPSPDEATEAFVAALGAQQANPVAMAALLGDDWRNYIPLDGVQRDDVDAFLDLYREQHALRLEGDQRAFLVVGESVWELPIPLVRGEDGWTFDTQAGGEIIHARRIGRNELSALQAVRAYHDAQMDYAEVDRDGDGVLEYARKIASSAGKHDGLYWIAQPDEEPSPLGPLFDSLRPGSDWHGYRYRILEAQGPSAPGGAYSYLIGDNMSRGFALVAWPAAYDSTGVMSFMISHDGQVFEKDLGPEGYQQVLGMSRFDPDSSWKEVTDEELGAATGSP